MACEALVFLHPEIVGRSQRKKMKLVFEDAFSPIYLEATSYGGCVGRSGCHWLMILGPLTVYSSNWVN